MTMPNVNRAYAELSKRFASANKLKGARDLLIWDSQTYMPEGGAWSRGEQLAALEAACSDLVAAPDTEELFGQAGEALDILSPLERSNLAEMRRIWSHQTAAPNALVMEKAKLSASLLGDWRNAKASNDFDEVANGFAQML